MLPPAVLKVYGVALGGAYIVIMVPLSGLNVNAAPLATVLENVSPAIKKITWALTVYGLVAFTLPKLTPVCALMVTVWVPCEMLKPLDKKKPLVLRTRS